MAFPPCCYSELSMLTFLPRVRTFEKLKFIILFEILSFLLVLLSYNSIWFGLLLYFERKSRRVRTTKMPFAMIGKSAWKNCDVYKLTFVKSKLTLGLPVLHFLRLCVRDLLRMRNSASFKLIQLCLKSLPEAGNGKTNISVNEQPIDFISA